MNISAIIAIIIFLGTMIGILSLIAPPQLEMQIQDCLNWQQMEQDYIAFELGQENKNMCAELDIDITSKEWKNI